MSTVRTFDPDALSAAPSPLMGEGWPAVSVPNRGEDRLLTEAELITATAARSRSRLSTRPAWLARLSDYIELTKPRISVMVLVTVAVAMFVGAWGPPAPWLLLHTLLGTALVAASASALNQRLERDTDARMARTANRPLPSGRLSEGDVIAFGGVSIAAGLIYLGLAVNWLTAALGALTWVLYVAIYTPLKTRTPLNTVVGAVAGAMPTLMGFAAVGASFSLAPGGDGVTAATLFLVVYLWQFPHFMAIAWIYRRDYAAAGLRMLTVTEPTGYLAGRQGLLAALALLPVSLAPVLNHAGLAYFAAALVLGLAYLACAASFFYRRNETSAWRLLRTSLVYLPALLILMMLAPLV
jgi:protoheme IX farnesyltransferase